jgi:hypothetical protein
MSDGLGQGYEGVGLGAGKSYKYILLWLSFLLLSTIIVNILIAVISDGFEIHKDKQRLRTKSGETFIVYAFHRLIYLTCFQFFPCCKKNETLWLKKMRFASSKHAKTLLKYTDALPDGMVFDQKLQIKVFQTLSKGKPETKLLEDMARDFFSNIKSEESLKWSYLHMAHFLRPLFSPSKFYVFPLKITKIQYLHYIKFSFLKLF